MKKILLVVAFLPGTFNLAFSQSIVASNFSTGFDAMANIVQLPLLHDFGTTTKQIQFI